MTREFHVSISGDNQASGSPTEPLRTIGEASNRALPGDTVVVHEGTYREWVDPKRGGTGPNNRITYTAADGARVTIKGSEVISGWTHEDGDVWRVSIDNAEFGDFNPFAVELEGDWLVRDKDEPKRHLGQVFIDGQRLFEAPDKQSVFEAQPVDSVLDRWTGTTKPVSNPDSRLLTWWAEVGDQRTTIWASFGSDSLEDRLVEVTFRPAVFFPKLHGRDYITVRGFEMAHAATQWAPPTTYQQGMVGPNWAKGWVIEDNVLHDSRCGAISLGKEESTGDNFFTDRRDRPGYQYQLESVFEALRRGWSEQAVGSHIVRRNTIYDCGENGIVGNLGAVFSTIEDNHIYNIGNDAEFFGHEIAGIKLHAAIDVLISHNRIDNCYLGIWLDWQTQGTRVTRNVLFDNWRDLFIEVSHGPYVIDNNVFGSAASLENLAQGGAYGYNLFCGTIRLDDVPKRSTPYHLAHSTEVAGSAVVYGGDDRLFGNVFLGGGSAPAYSDRWQDAPKIGHGTSGYDEHDPSWDAYQQSLDEQPAGDIEMFLAVPQPVYIESNAYGQGASPYQHETGAFVADPEFSVELVDKGSTINLRVRGGSAAPCAQVKKGSELPPARIVGLPFEAADGSELDFGIDIIGRRRPADAPVPPGPLSQWPSDGGEVQIWP